eukprot:5845300-Pleurochrysis_carterae.AAC.1
MPLSSAQPMPLSFASLDLRLHRAAMSRSSFVPVHTFVRVCSRLTASGCSRTSRAAQRIAVRRRSTAVEEQRALSARVPDAAQRGEGEPRASFAPPLGSVSPPLGPPLDAAA